MDSAPGCGVSVPLALWRFPLEPFPVLADGRQHGEEASYERVSHVSDGREHYRKGHIPESEVVADGVNQVAHVLVSVLRCLTVCIHYSVAENNCNVHSSQFGRYPTYPSY